MAASPRARIATAPSAIAWRVQSCNMAVKSAAGGAESLVRLGEKVQLAARESHLERIHECPCTRRRGCVVRSGGHRRGGRSVNSSRAYVLPRSLYSRRRDLDWPLFRPPSHGAW